MTELLDLNETAKALRVPVATLRHWRATGTGPAFFRQGKRLFTTQEDVNAWIASQREKAMAR